MAFKQSKQDSLYSSTRSYAFIALALIATASLARSGSISHSPSNLDSPLEDIKWCGDNQNNDQLAVLLTAKGSVYHSTDRGATWQRMSDSFTRAGINSRLDLNTNIGTVTSMISSPIDSNEIVFAGSNGVNWISNDCGATVSTLGINLNLKEFVFHPTNRLLMLASSWTVCPKEKASSDCVITKDLYLTKDKGKTWKLLTKYVVQFAWAVSKNTGLMHVPKDRILYSKENGNKSHQKVKGWNAKTHLYYSDDFLQNSKLIVNQGNKFLLTETFLFVAQVHTSEDQKVKLMVSKSDLKEYSFAEAEIPQEVTQHSFTVLDTTEGQIFLNINHLGSQSPLGTIYKSDGTGTRFTASLHNNLRSADGQCDFEEVNGLEGVYISNVYTGKKTDDVKVRLGQKNPDQIESDIPTEKQNRRKQTGGVSKSATSTLKENMELLQDTIVSRISFDKGGSWVAIKPPAKDVNGKTVNCDVSKNCSLHLHSVSSQIQFGPTYSSENSVGLIMATGNIGSYLSQKAGRVNTYLSRDGGLNWEEVRLGSHIYEIADHGSLILMANDQKPTDSIIYSWDEGLTWNTKKISETPIQISNIVTEPGNTSDKFIVYGHAEGDSDLTGLVVLVDFEQLHPRDCTGFDNPNQSNSDYETWVPHNPNETCLLGREMKFVRRKRDAACFNPEKFERPVSIRNCECSESDWECDIGFQRQDNGQGPCVPYKGYTVDYNPPSSCSGTYTVTQGFQKAVGNICRGGVDRAPLVMSCPIFGFIGSGIFSDILIISGMLGIFYGISKKKDDILQVLATYKLDGYLTTITSQISTLSSKVSSLISSDPDEHPSGYFQPDQTDEENTQERKKPKQKKTIPQFEDNLIDYSHNEPETKTDTASASASAAAPAASQKNATPNLLDEEDEYINPNDPF